MRLSFTAAVAFALATAAVLPAQARDQIQVTGSSTVLPYASIVAEAFGENTKFKTPVVEGGGTSAGIKRFCEGVGENTPDIANASRKMSESERSTCRKNGVTEIVEVPFGYDGIVFASALNGPEFVLTPATVFNAIAKNVVVNGKAVPNPYTKWSQINPKLPDQEIKLIIPGSKHGTREVFDTKVVERGCKIIEADKKLKGISQAEKPCLEYRTDGRVVEVDGDYTETLARLKNDSDSLGVFGLAFYENNTDFLRVANFQGVTPSRATVASGDYSVSRPLYFYIKKAHIGTIPGLLEYAQFFVSDEMAGKGGPLEAYGLVPDPKLSAIQGKLAGIK